MPREEAIQLDRQFRIETRRRCVPYTTISPRFLPRKEHLYTILSHLHISGTLNCEATSMPCPQKARYRHKRGNLPRLHIAVFQSRNQILLSLPTEYCDCLWWQEVWWRPCTTRVSKGIHITFLNICILQANKIYFDVVPALKLSLICSEGSKSRLWYLDKKGLKEVLIRTTADIGTYLSRALHFVNLFTLDWHVRGSHFFKAE